MDGDGQRLEAIAGAGHHQAIVRPWTGWLKSSEFLPERNLSGSEKVRRCTPSCWMQSLDALGLRLQVKVALCKQNTKVIINPFHKTVYLEMGSVVVGHKRAKNYCLRTGKPGLVAHACHSGTWEFEARGWPLAWSQLGLHSELQASLTEELDLASWGWGINNDKTQYFVTEINITLISWCQWPWIRGFPNALLESSWNANSKSSCRESSVAASSVFSKGFVGLQATLSPAASLWEQKVRLHVTWQVTLPCAIYPFWSWEHKPARVMF